MCFKIVSIKPKKNLILEVLFDNSITKYYDVKKLIDEDKNYSILEEWAIFQNVKIICGGHGIEWTSELDLSECELWACGTAE